MLPQYHYVYTITLYDGTQTQYRSREKISKERYEEIRNNRDMIYKRIKFKEAAEKKAQRDEEFFDCSEPIIVGEPEC